MVLITGTVAVAAATATVIVTAESTPIWYVGLRHVPGSEILQAGTFLEWFAETPTGGGNFGSGPPNNPRVRARGILTGALRQDAYLGADDPTPTNALVLSTATLTGTLRVSALIQQNVLTTTSQVFGNLGLTLFLTSEINAVSVVTGRLLSIVFPELDPEVLVGVLGRRPCFPLLIYVEAVTHLDNLQVDGVLVAGLYQAFLISPDFVPTPGEQMTNQGALPNSIGMRVITDIQGDGIEEEVLLFRRPLENEVVCVVQGAKVLRWYADSQSWRVYRTLPQRALDGVRAFEILDPDGIYDYFARILGLKYAQLARDTSGLLPFIDPTQCPSQFVSVLARNFGAPVDADQPEVEQRETMRNWTPLMQIKGTEDSIVTALKGLGFKGHATHIWVKPGGAADEFQERPFNFDESFPSGSADEFYPASQVAIHLNNPDGSPLVVIDDGVKQKVATFLKENILPAHVRIRTFTTDVAVGAEGVEVDDGNALAIFRDTRVAIVTAVAGPATTAISGRVLPLRATVVAQASTATVVISGQVIG